MASRNGVRAEALPGSILLVVHDFIARSQDELSLAKGDRIELIERDDDFGDGWFLGRHMVNGDTGLFPEVYTTTAPKGTLTGTPHQRRVSENPPKSAGNDTIATSPTTQQRHSSARPTTANQTSPLAPTIMRSSLPSPIATSNAARTNTFNADSPVMNETLSVIDEHITDMNTPRSSYINGNKRDTMGSVYSQGLNRLSYIPGHETDEDEHTYHTEEEVNIWSPERVAEYLEDHGVERSHCEVFKEQEITGEVLLAMDQSSLFIKEFELGPVGRRLKTWHKIKALQDEVRRSASPERAKSTSEYSGRSGLDDDATSVVSDAPRNRSSTIGTVLPRGLEPRQSIDGRSNTLSALPTFPATPQSQAGAAATMSRASSSAMSPLQSMTSMSRPENTYRPSAQSVRAMQHSRRHSSIDSTSSAGGTVRSGHRKQPSIDKQWQPGQAMSQAVNGNMAASGASHAFTMSSGASSAQPPKRESSLMTPSTPDDLDRGYFSSNEVDNRSSTGHPKGNVLTKKSFAGLVSPMQSRTNSVAYTGKRQSIGQQSSILSSDSVREPVSPLSGGGTQQMLQQMFNQVSSVQSKFGSRRSATSPTLESKAMADMQSPVSPVVTKLDYSEKPSINAALVPSGETPSKDATPSPSSSNLGFFGGQRQKITGLRAISDAVTNKEKQTVETPVSDRIPPTLNEKGEPISSPTRTGSTTPSTETRSFDMQKSVDGQSRTSTGSGSKLMPPPRTATQRKMRPKTKKTTSAYTRGLEKKPPAEKMQGCDYSGWMKKKSGSLMTTWKSRLFILKGRRLSYYYKDDDTEEKGLIDISFHRVLPAEKETLTGLHAAVTGAASTSNPTSPTSSTTPQTAAEKDLKENPVKPGGGEDSGLFIFKLVPPKSGLSKGVSFTKPTVHYFAVNSRQEGRLWMAALMKATIDRDDEGVVTTTYNQKTISLAKARARRERPPVLKEEEVEGRAELDGGSDTGSGAGLGIGGLAEGAESPAVGGGAEQDKTSALDDAASSIAPSSMAATGAEDSSEGLDEREKEAVALNASS